MTKDHRYLKTTLTDRDKEMIKTCLECKLAACRDGSCNYTDKYKDATCQTLADDTCGDGYSGTYQIVGLRR